MSISVALNCIPSPRIPSASSCIVHSRTAFFTFSIMSPTAGPDKKRRNFIGIGGLNRELFFCQSPIIQIWCVSGIGGGVVLLQFHEVDVLGNNAFVAVR